MKDKQLEYKAIDIKGKKYVSVSEINMKKTNFILQIFIVGIVIVSRLAEIIDFSTLLSTLITISVATIVCLAYVNLILLAYAGKHSMKMNDHIVEVNEMIKD